MVKCCNNCANIIPYSKNNSYGDADYLCIKTGYFVTGRDKDITKIKRCTPGGKELTCEWKQKEKDKNEKQKI